MKKKTSPVLNFLPSTMMTCRAAGAIFFLCLNFIGVASHSQSWLWAKRAGGAANEEGRSIAMDPDGNVLVTGYFRSPTITFGSITLTNIDTTTTADVFVAKYNSLGTVLWAKKAIGTANDVGRAIATDASGNVYITGYFRSPTLNFGTVTLINTVSSFADVFLAKYNSAGTLLWAKNIGGKNNDFANGIAVDESSNVYVTGYFKSDTINFGTSSIMNSSAGFYDFLLLKYNNAGTFQWAYSTGGTGDDQGHCISVSSGKINVGGYFKSPSVTFGTNTLTNAQPGFDDYFVASFNDSGNVIWAKSAGGGGDDRVYGITTDASNNISISGKFSSTSFSVDAIPITNISAGGTSDIFLIKMNSTGNAIWANTIGGTGNDLTEGICSDIYGNIYMTGIFSSSSIAIGAFTLTNSVAGNSDIFISKYDTSGIAAWAVRAGESNNDYGQSIACNGEDNLFITGFFRSPFISFGSTILINASPSTQDLFVANYKYPTSLPITLISFSASKKDNYIQVNWTTASESNNDYFTIEKSKDATDFYSLGTIDGQGNSSVLQDYYFVDHILPEGISYYRLKQTDFDGTNTYSHVIAVSDNIPEAIKLLLFSYSPCSDQIEYSLNCKQKLNLSITLSGPLGTTVFQNLISMDKGINKKNLNIAGLSAGMYLLQLTTSDFFMQKKIMIVK